MKLEITVTQEDIDMATETRTAELFKKYLPTDDLHELASRWHPCTGCPVALAMRRALGLGKDNFLCISRRMAYGDSGFNGNHYELPEEAVQFQKEWDNQRPVKPLKFFINDGRKEAARNGLPVTHRLAEI